MHFKQFNLAITDPPYNVGRKYNTHDDSQDASDYEQWCKDWLNELLRVSETVVMTVGYKNLKMCLKVEKFKRTIFLEISVSLFSDYMV